jgi:DNA invertase Pin-like site-specific DNA recombinase/uncharacterized protein (DUF2164 family)
MQAHGLVSYRDIYLDDAVSGSKLKRPGFDAMLKEVKSNHNISTVFVFKRDRLGRPRDPVDMMVVDRDLRSWGVRVEMSDGVIDPTEQGSAVLGQTAMSLFAYHESGEFSKKLSERIVLVQTSIARRGFSTGGRPPYGFGRYLVDAADKVVEELLPGRKVKADGCHVRFLPNDEGKIGVWLQILGWLEQGWGCQRVAEHLNRLGVPGPDAGRVRGGEKLGGRVSGKWNHTTVRSLAMNPLIIGVKEYGRFSQGMHHRIGLNGPRSVTNDELLDDGGGRVIENPRELWIRAESGGQVFFDQARWERLQLKLAERGAAQRGRRRAPDDTAYPLAARVFDLTNGCGSIMQGAARTDRGNRRRLYRCGIYMKRRGECHHNSVDAEALLKFAVRTLAAILQNQGGVAKIEAAVRARLEAAAKTPPSPTQSIRAELAAKIERLRRQVENAPRLILEEEDSDLRSKLRAASREMTAELSDAEAQLARCDAECPPTTASDIETQVQNAMELFRRIELVCSNPAARRELPRLLDDIGMRIGLQFRAGGPAKQPVRVLCGGVVAFGNRPLPCALRTSGGRPLAGGLPREDEDRRQEGHDNDGCRDAGRHHEHAGGAWSPSTGKTTPSRRRGRSTEAKPLARGAKGSSPVDDSSRRQSSRTERLSKGNSSGRT